MSDKIIFSEPCYDIDEIMRHNMHTHTRYSRCATKRQGTLEEMIKTAIDDGLKTLAITDHYYTDDYTPILDDFKLIKEYTDNLNCDLKISVGCEFSCYDIGKTAENNEEHSAAEYRLYACNHYHVEPWVQPEEKTPEGYVKHQFELVKNLLLSGKADCIAHPLYDGYIHRGFGVLCDGLYTENQIGELLTTAKENSVAWEINFNATNARPELARKMWNIGKEVGVTFHYGADAHTLDAISTSDKIEIIKSVLNK